MQVRDYLKLLTPKTDFEVLSLLFVFCRCITRSKSQSYPRTHFSNHPNYTKTRETLLTLRTIINTLCVRRTQRSCSHKRLHPLGSNDDPLSPRKNHLRSLKRQKLQAEHCEDVPFLNCRGFDRSSAKIINQSRCFRKCLISLETGSRSTAASF